MWEIVLMYVKAFAVGGIICAIAQVLINTTKMTSGRILVLFLLLGVFFQAVGLYQHLIDFAGAGATVPISGFGYLLAEGAINGAQTGLFGALTGGLKAGAAGITAAIVFSFLMSIIFKPHSKYN